jgi:hypothetical protein
MQDRGWVEGSRLHFPSSLARDPLRPWRKRIQGRAEAGAVSDGRYASEETLNTLQ